jgi:GNAT superfamily N-acetyltransferase
MKVTLRDARLQDAEAISRLTGHLGYDVSSSDVAARLTRLMPHLDHRFFIADVDGRAVGWLHVSAAEYLETGAFAVINGLVVDRAARSSGIGKLLLERAEAWAIERGLPAIRLWSTTSRDRAHRFYERHGYVNIKTQFAFIKSLDAGGGKNFAALVPRIEG